MTQPRKVSISIRTNHTIIISISSPKNATAGMEIQKYVASDLAFVAMTGSNICRTLYTWNNTFQTAWRLCNKHKQKSVLCKRLWILQGTFSGISSRIWLYLVRLHLARILYREPLLHNGKVYCMGASIEVFTIGLVRVRPFNKRVALCIKSCVISWGYWVGECGSSEVCNCCWCSQSHHSKNCSSYSWRKSNS